MALPYPKTRNLQTRWILDQRQGIPHTSDLSSLRPSHWLRESEPDVSGAILSILTVFLTNRECPWHCLMCDLWRHTLQKPVPPGAIPAQIDFALDADRRLPSAAADWIKLYNAGSFFDPGAIPTQDWPAIADRCRPFSRVVVECHPRLVQRRILPFRDLLGASTHLEIALGLETVHPQVLERLNKGITLDGFRQAAGFIRDQGMDLRVFVLVKPPFLDETDALDWANQSTEFAFRCGANTVSLIPTRSGNGALETLQAIGQFSPPRPETLEAALRYGLSLKQGRVFADTWDLDQLGQGTQELEKIRDRLHQMNLTQTIVAS